MRALAPGWPMADAKRRKEGANPRPRDAKYRSTYSDMPTVPPSNAVLTHERPLAAPPMTIMP